MHSHDMLRVLVVRGILIVDPFWLRGRNANTRVAIHLEMHGTNAEGVRERGDASLAEIDE